MGFDVRACYRRRQRDVVRATTATTARTTARLADSVGGGGEHRDATTATNYYCHCYYYYAVVHGAVGKRQTAGGAQPANVDGTQVGHGVQPERRPLSPPATAATTPSPPADAPPAPAPTAAAPTAARRFRRLARATRPPKHGQGGQRQQHRFER